jgi:hypothetical protein
MNHPLPSEEPPQEKEVVIKAQRKKNHLKNAKSVVLQHAANTDVRPSEEPLHHP